MTFSLAEDLAPIIRPAALMVEGVTVVERDGQLDAPIAEARVRRAPPADRIGPFGNPSSDSLRTCAGGVERQRHVL